MTIQKQIENQISPSESKVIPVSSGELRNQEQINCLKEKLKDRPQVKFDKSVVSVDETKEISCLERDVLSTLQKQIMASNHIANYLDIPNSDLSEILDRLLNFKYVEKIDISSKTISNSEKIYYALTKLGRNKLK